MRKARTIWIAPISKVLGAVAHSRAAIEGRIRQTRINGYSVNPGLVVEGSWGIGRRSSMRSVSPSGRSVLTGVEARFAGERTELLGETLLRAAHELTQRLQRKL